MTALFSAYFTEFPEELDKLCPDSQRPYRRRLVQDPRPLKDGYKKITQEDQGVARQ